MGNLFDMESPIMVMLGKLADVMLVSVIFILCCIPIVTMGASFTALYYTTAKCVRKGRSYIFQSFWKSFKENFVKATILWVILLAVISILGLNIWFALGVVGKFGFVLLCVYGLMAFIMLNMSTYIFPMLSRFEVKNKQLLKNCLLMSIRHLPFSVLMLFIFLAMFVVCIFFPPAIFFAPGVGALIMSFPMERIFKKYITSSGDETLDEWYL